VIRSSVGGLGDDAFMTTALLFLLALALGVALGVWVGRQQSASRGQQELLGLRDELATARIETAQARADAGTAQAQRDAAAAQVAEVEVGRRAMVDQFRLLSSEIAEQQRLAVDNTAAHRLEATEKALAPVTAGLKDLQTRITSVEKERVEMAGHLRAHVREVRDTGEALRKETAVLVTALRKPQVRGTWGETTLKNVARMAGMVEHCDFDVQVTSQTEGQTLRPDMRVSLAEGKYVFVDSKVPLAAFLEAAETDDEQQKAAALIRFARHVRTHVDQLSSKQYWKGAESPEFVVLFLPSEGFFTAALDQMPDLYEYAIGKDVVLATPTTLIAMLRAVSYGWKQAALAKDAAEVARLGRELYERLGLLGSKVDKLGRALGGAVNAYNETVGTVEARVLVTARRFRDLKVTDKELAAPEIIESAIRPIQAPELVDDAVQVEPMVGRTRREQQPPEVEALWRTDPDLDELVAGDLELSRAEEDDRREA
jgi:DNA recombination protein RmuC